LINQRITTASAEAICGNARLAAEDAELAAKSNRDDLFPRERREIEGETTIAEAELALAEEEHKAIKARQHNQSELMRAELATTRARFAVEKSKNRLHVLNQYTKDQRTRELSNTVELTRSNERVKKATLELEREKEKKLERQIAACSIVAPIDGTVVYADRVGMQAEGGAGSQLQRIGVGATVLEQQLILRVVPTPRTDGEAR
jgi:hypothetical protein